MDNGDGVVVGSCHDLVPGDAVEAYSRAGLVHRGPVVDAIPECGLLWILDTVTGSRCVLDLSELEIVRLPGPAVRRKIRRFLPNGRQPAGGTPSFNWRDASPRR